MDTAVVVALVAHNEPTTWDIACQRPGDQLVDLLTMPTPEDALRVVVRAQLKAAVGPIACFEDIGLDFVRELLAVMQVRLRPPIFFGYAKGLPVTTFADRLCSADDVLPDLVCEGVSRSDGQGRRPGSRHRREAAIPVLCSRGLPAQTSQSGSVGGSWGH